MSVIADRDVTAPAVTRPFAQRVRRAVVIVIVASFSIAAVAGIVVLFGDVSADPAIQVLATTALIGAFSVAVFCGAVLIGKSGEPFGWATVAVALLTLCWCLWLVWAQPDGREPIWELTLTAVIVTAALAVSSLLLLLLQRRILAVRLGLFVTLALIGIGVVLAILPVWDLAPHDIEPYLRVTGIVWILAALGAVVLPIVTLALRNARPTAPGAPTARLSAAAVRRIEDAARAAGLPPDELVARLLPPSPEKAPAGDS